MGRFVSKCNKESGEAAVMEKPLDTAAAAAAGRKRKNALGETETSKSSIQLKSRRLTLSTADNSASPACNSCNSTCESVSSGRRVLASCCSSSRPRELAKETSKSVDLEIPQENEGSVEFFATSADNSVDIRDDGREKTMSSDVDAESGELESTEGPRDSNSRRRRSAAAVEKMPTEAELEEFFTAAENNLQKQFIDKYNYDIVKDEPLEGRYEWVQIQLKP